MNHLISCLIKARYQNQRIRVLKDGHLILVRQFHKKLIGDGEERVLPGQ